MAKQVYTWSKVTAGDIISFRYKGNKPTGTLTTLLVMNPKLPFTKKDGNKTFHLIGLKLEERGTIPTIRSKPILVQLLERVGEIQVVSGDDQIYRINIKNVGARGAIKQIYEKIKRYITNNSVYRTYNWNEARKSAVFLEPITLPKGLRELLSEN
tara:strand:+ start:13 stop:477 length:465 start_codon:yes stop_codon:yes gene_type:complete